MKLKTFSINPVRSFLINRNVVMINNKKNNITSNGIKLINFYQKFLSPSILKFLEHFGLLKNNSCVFYPSCSEYTKEAIKKYGILKGSFLGFIRILRCHPWQKNHIDLLK